MARSDAATVLLALDREESQTSRSPQGVRGVLHVCPNTVLVSGAASDRRGTRWDAAERPVLAGKVGTVMYRVTVAFSVSAEELEEIVEENLSHARSTDVRVEVVRRPPATATRP